MSLHSWGKDDTPWKKDQSQCFLSSIKIALTEFPPARALYPPPFQQQDSKYLWKRSFFQTLKLMNIDVEKTTKLSGLARRKQLFYWITSSESSHISVNNEFG